MEVVIFGIKLTVNPVAFTITLGEKYWDIYWYGVIIATGFLLALIYGMTNAKRFGLDLNRMLDVVLVTTPVAILCARTYYVIFDGVKLTSVADFFGFGESSGIAGLAIYGGVIGAFVTGAVMCLIRKVKILDMFDIAAVGFLIGQGIGRWGNFINQEAYGDFTGSSWWGMQSERTISEMGGEGLVHPCFLYESIWCILGFFLLHFISKKRKFSGQLVLTYGVWYGFGRGFIELLRTDSLMLGNIRVSSLLSFLLCIASATLLIILLKRVKSDDSAQVYADVFDVSDDESEKNGSIQIETENLIDTEESEEIE